MARKRKRTEPAAVPLEEIPRDLEELTSEEAEAAKGGFLSWSPMFAYVASQAQTAEDPDGIYTSEEIFGTK